MLQPPVTAGVAAIVIVVLTLTAAAQTTPKAVLKKSPATAKPASTKPAPSAAPHEPATPEAAAKVLDLRTFPLMEGAKVGGIHTLAILMYEAQGTPQQAFEFQRRELTKRGFKELPGGYTSAETNSGHFTKDGFIVAVSSSPGFDPAKKGWSSVTLVNSGNVDLQKLPVPPGVKPFHPQPTEASYTTTAKPTETAAACRKLLLAAGWEPYGQASPDGLQPDSSMQYFKRNGIKLQSWIMTTPAEGGKTLIRYSADLLSADLPAPPGTGDLDYTDSQKTLRFAAAADQTDGIIAFYQERLTKMGWKATTDKPIVDDQKNTKFLIFRNAAKELLSLDLDVYENKVEVELFHQTAAELAEEERLAKDHAEKEKLAEAERNKKFTVKVLLPAEAQNLDKVSERTIEFELATGSGPKALAALRDHYLKEGWTEKEGTEFDKNTGDMEMTKGDLALDLSYFDTGITDASIRVSGSFKVVLETVAAKDAAGGKSASNTAKSKPGKKPAASAIPGLPDLPPGVEVPDEVKALLEKALQEAGQKPAPGRKP